MICMGCLQGPREDAGTASPVNVGVRLAAAMYDFTRQFGAGTKIVMTGIRSMEEAVQLSGADYLVLSDKLQAQLSSADTLQVCSTHGRALLVAMLRCVMDMVTTVHHYC
jgi:hypothetical protein